MLDGIPHGIRPEKLRIGPAAAAAAHRRQGVIEELTFLGTGLRILARTPDGPLVALAPVDSASGALAVGDELTLGFDPADAMPLPGAR
jgi:putative spermidine/putrescine transport system ATP-binding protein/spermidine/putrescine transport system ATP-binding protein